MKIKSIQIKNILGITELDIKPGTVTKIQGLNGTGKTSVLEAIKSVFAGGHDATLVRNGAAKGEIVLILDNDIELRKTVTSKSSELTVKDPEFGIIPKPATWLAKMVDLMSSNPVEFLNCPEKKRAEYLLEALPLKLTNEELAEITLKDRKGMVAPEDHALDVLSMLKTAAFDERTGVNRIVKEKEGALAQLRQTLPADAETSTAKQWEKKRDSLQNSIDTANGAYDLQVKAIEKKRDKRLEELKAQEEKELEAVRNKFSLWRDEARTTAEGELKSEAEAVKESTEKLQQQLGEAKTKATEFGRVAETVKNVEAMEADIQKLRAESDELTAKLERIETAKKKVLSRLPIPGIEIVDGKVFCNGVVWERLNEAKKIEIAVGVAKLRSKKLGLVCVDGLESLDESSLELFEEQIESAGLQAIMTRVSESPLEVSVR